MKALYPLVDIAVLSAQVEASAGFGQVRELNDGFAAASPDIVAAVLEEAAKFAAGYLEALNETMDRTGCCLADGRVRTAGGHVDAWRAFAESGWPGLDQPEALGGQGLPRVVMLAVQEILDRANPAFGMMPVATRSAARLISAWGDEALRTEWLPRLVAGDWSATICISEAEAGSDVARIRSRADQDDGLWRITGEKCWISYADQDLTGRIGHCVLAMTQGERPGLSLFLVPDSIDGHPNNIVVRRIEEKMGLHGSPTCAMGFEGARGHLLGQAGRGLAQMFVMIANMRMSVAAAGLGIADGCVATALSYAHERQQGGSGPSPLPIARHPDVQRQLLDMASRVEAFRGLLYATANMADLADHAGDVDAEALTQWLLPIVKTTGAELGFDAASAAMQVLGGAGYTRDWPVEQALRDARVLSIFEGTTGIQALDLLHRRLLRERRGLDVFLKAARDVIAGCAGTDLGGFAACLDCLETTAGYLARLAEDRKAAEAGADAFLRLAAQAAMGWSAARLIAAGGVTSERLVALAGYFLSGIGPRAAALAAVAVESGAALDRFARVL